MNSSDLAEKGLAEIGSAEKGVL